MDKYLPFILLIISAIFRSLDQTIRWKQQDQTWLPKWIWTWHIGNFEALDAEHVYMGLKMTLSWIGFLFLPIIHPIFFYEFPFWKQLFVFALLWIGYYQTFNLFFHIIWKLKI